ncbi:NnrU protein [Marinomonas spartinae]|uniref:NnrU protein n=1 Tax=Marinomonas spartinae TaxID=1792290 RepID=A0A1A8TNC4_9GAMM|nr:NnrU family protein [Marinomonas spartinae]SBS32784.1 NnrU protein [Marinomonas spartinae]SBS35619.1 NnrU protein [Marinomonas spartinae]
MLILVIGLVMFFVLHSVQIMAPKWREEGMLRHGKMRWQMRFGMGALISVAFIWMGFTQVRLDPTWIWLPPAWIRQVSSLLMLFSFYFAACALIPGTKLKAMTGRPFLLAVKLWAFAHLISNGKLEDIIIFGSFLVWSIVAYAVLRRRDRAEGIKHDYIGIHMDLAAFTITMITWFGMVFYFHKLLFGVAPLV